jgi:salicylate hydroxylase
VPPNSSRLSRLWGVDFDSIKKEVATGLRFIDFKGKPLLEIPYSNVEEKYSAPYYFLHRADLIKLLVKTASEREDVTLRMNTKVASYDFDAPSLTLASGEILQADLIICADGIKSSVRNTINGTPVSPQDTGDVAYRVLVPAERLRADPELSHLLDESWAMHWLGPEAHAVGYPLRNKELYNVIIDITHETDLGEPIGDEEWRSQADNTELVARFADWCAPVRKLCGLTDEYLKWKLADFDHLQRWVHTSGKVAMIGVSAASATAFLSARAPRFLR